MAEIRLGMLNLWMFSKASHHARQIERLSDEHIDVLLLQEVDVRRLPALTEALGFDWYQCSLGPDVRDKRLGVAIVGRQPITVVGRDQLTVEDFVNPEVYPELARWFHERHLALDLSLGDGRPLRVGAFHATPGTSKGPGTANGRLGVGRRKPWFHTRLAEWIATWDPPFLFGIDANTPAVDACDLNDSRFHRPVEPPGGPGEDRLLGPPTTTRHDGVDLWRTWLDSSAGESDRAAVPHSGPLARSYTTGNDKWFRYDQIWASADVQPTAMAYSYDREVSDHALVTVTIEVDVEHSVHPRREIPVTLSESQVDPGRPGSGSRDQEAKGVDAAAMFDVNDLIEAMSNHLRWQSAHADLRDYWSQRYDLLVAGLGLTYDPLDDTAGDMGAGGLRLLLKAAALGTEQSPSPFSGFLEADEAVIDIYQRFAPELDELSRLHDQVHRAVARACLVALDPALEDRTCPTTILTEAGIVLSPPDPFNYL